MLNFLKKLFVAEKPTPFMRAVVENGMVYAILPNGEIAGTLKEGVMTIVRDVVKDQLLLDKVMELLVSTARDYAIACQVVG
jgi:hypothetical protein